LRARSGGVGGCKECRGGLASTKNRKWRRAPQGLAAPRMWSQGGRWKVQGCCRLVDGRRPHRRWTSIPECWMTSTACARLRCCEKPWQRGRQENLKTRQTLGSSAKKQKMTKRELLPTYEMTRVTLREPLGGRQQGDPYTHPQVDEWGGHDRRVLRRPPEKQRTGRGAAWTKD
jgi:hypothetical protein